MRTEKLTDAGRERLRAVALLKLEIPRCKTLAVELNITPNYVRQMLCRFMRELERTNKRALTSQPAIPVSDQTTSEQTAGTS